jgi:predicted nucleic acid-binding protein
MALARRRGRGLSSVDGLIAATAMAHNLTMATRDMKDFEGFAIELFDPWTA